MNWLTSKRSGGNSVFSFNGCGVCVVVSGESGGAMRVKLVLSNQLIAAYRLQAGDRLQAGFTDDGRLMLRRHSDGNTITGRGFTKKRPTTKTKGSAGSQPYVAFEAATYAGVYQWARQLANKSWIEMVDHGTHWESVANG